MPKDFMREAEKELVLSQMLSYYMVFCWWLARLQ